MEWFFLDLWKYCLVGWCVGCWSWLCYCLFELVGEMFYWWWSGWVLRYWLCLFLSVCGWCRWFWVFVLLGYVGVWWCSGWSSFWFWDVVVFWVRVCFFRYIVFLVGWGIWRGVFLVCCFLLGIWWICWLLCFVLVVSYCVLLIGRCWFCVVWIFFGVV